MDRKKLRIGEIVWTVTAGSLFLAVLVNTTCPFLWRYADGRKKSWYFMKGLLENLTRDRLSKTFRKRSVLRFVDLIVPCAEMTLDPKTDAFYLLLD